MDGRKIWLGSGFVFTALLCGSSAATQYLASKFGYHPQLGGEIGNGIYLPWQWLSWGRLVEKYPQIIADAQMVGLSVTFCLSMFSVLILLASQRNQKEKPIHDLHGSAHFAEKEDIDQMSLLMGSGVYVGAWEKGHSHKRSKSIRRGQR